ncbi:MAG: carbohydrate binding domain-containing protein [Candidatus Diapherotrites archaeon]
MKKKIFVLCCLIALLFLIGCIQSPEQNLNNVTGAATYVDAFSSRDYFLFNGDFDLSLPNNSLLNGSFEEGGWRYPVLWFLWKATDVSKPKYWFDFQQVNSSARLVGYSSLIGVSEGRKAFAVTLGSTTKDYWLYQPVKLQPGKTYKLSSYISAQRISSNQDYGCEVYLYNPNSAELSAISTIAARGTTSMQQYAKEFAIPAGITVAAVMVGGKSPSGTCYFDEVNLLPTEFNGDGIYTVHGGETIVSDEGFKIKINNIDRTSDPQGYPLLNYSVLSADGFLVKEGYAQFTEGFTQTDLVFPKSYLEGIKPGAFNLTEIDDTHADFMEIKVDSCPILASIKGIGEKKILFVPAYTYAARDAINDHAKLALNVYSPAFSDVINYVKFKQNQLIERELLSISFTVTDPIVVPSEADYYQKSDSIKKILNYIREQTNFEPSNFDLLVFQLYIGPDEQPLAETPYSEGIIAHNKVHTPEAAFDWENRDVFYSNTKPLYTKAMLHEILHGFGMSDEIAYNSTYYLGSVFYIGSYFDGTQELIAPGPGNTMYRNVTEIQNEAERRLGNKFLVGEFQQINELMAQELGWKDINDNNVIDVYEACEQNCIIEENARVDSQLANITPYDFCSLKN